MWRITVPQHNSSSSTKVYIPLIFFSHRSVTKYGGCVWRATFVSQQWRCVKHLNAQHQTRLGKQTSENILQQLFAFLTYLHVSLAYSLIFRYQKKWLTNEYFIIHNITYNWRHLPTVAANYKMLFYTNLYLFINIYKWTPWQKCNHSNYVL